MKIIKKIISLSAVLMVIFSAPTVMATSADSVFILEVPDGVNINPLSVCRESFYVSDMEKSSEIIITDVLFYPGTPGRIKLFTKDLLDYEKSYIIESIGILDENGNAVLLSEILIPNLEFESALDDVYLQGLLESKTDESSKNIKITLSNSSKIPYNSLDCFLAVYEGNQMKFITNMPVALESESSKTADFENIPVKKGNVMKIFVFNGVNTLNPIKNSGYDSECR